MNEWNEHVILVGVSTSDGDDTEDSLYELEELVKTAGASVDAIVIQNLPYINSATYVGKGKLEELHEMVLQTEATGIVCDDELTPAQLRNMEAVLGVKIMDRTLIILDIFAQHARSNEGKIQVELAQLRYQLTRLKGLGGSMSRLGGGIGTRGPGETKLEVDRRLISSRISKLKQELIKIESHRELTRKARERNGKPVAAIVGYTNAGKSTLLNALTDAGILAEDQLFATLDTTTRLLNLPSGQELLLTDTVGFIRKLPHHLVDAFRSTLEEAKYADYVIHVVDASSREMEKQMHTVYDTLQELGITGKKVITIFNKIDLLEEDEIIRDGRADYTIRISAKEGTNLTGLMELLEQVLREDRVLIERILPYDKMSLLNEVRKNGEILTEEYKEDGIHISAYVPMALYGHLC